jgi:hypothetical protein
MADRLKTTELFNEYPTLRTSNIRHLDHTHKRIPPLDTILHVVVFHGSFRPVQLM